MEKRLPLEKTETKLINNMLLEELMEKVESYCNERDMTVKNFVTDA